MKAAIYNLWAISCLLLFCSCSTVNRAQDSYVRVSAGNPAYFETSDGRTYIPVGCNIAALGRREQIDHYLDRLASNGCNFGRVWLNSALFEVQTVYGEVNEEHLDNIVHLLDGAKSRGIKIKLCIESFRHIRPGKNKWDTKASYHKSNGGPFENSEDYITSDKGKEEFLKRLSIIKERVGDHPAVFGWELWNEMNAVDCSDIRQWNEYMLPKVKEMFGKNLVMQSLGSLDRESSFPIYEFINGLESNEVAQVHRYLDMGADLQICHAPMDSLCEDAVKVLLSYNLRKPVLLAEGGAVKPVHTGPSLLYPLDKDGILLHDVLFAPFFSGAAGPGHSWHWDHYIEKYDKWHVFKGFAAAIEGVDPVKEYFRPEKLNIDDLKWYCLKGKKTDLIWVRDALNTWQNEFEEGHLPRVISGTSVNMETLTGGRKVKEVLCFDPWTESWSEIKAEEKLTLPEFKRSLVIKIKY